ncbi:immunoglobulin-like domain-containing protein [Candidatus Xianfuyuplasma coldseepsis]|uniref:LTD domain-containing protein n=1 Tax=Candidatus Xianfuyuplasma coldseepsis TaxID=2782163 RepID=A0A7L7KQB5_9MOLU|nr:immunoglobulin-like domain-containing protein [Xianfuyuplasma coldseepsis]QMS84980.1 hypothetical protein G4Z02_04160 [Xianfuyuplasma coldseepsis]
MKKVLVFLSVFAFALGLAACKDEVDPVDAENIADALQKLSLDISDPLAVTEDITLPAEGLHDVTITWSSDNTDVIANDGTVTRPAVGEADVTVKITATITLGDLTETKEFTVKVKAEVPSLAVTMAEFLSETVAVGDVVELTGTVIGVIPDAGYHLYADGVATYVYVGAAFDPVVGDNVTVKGSKTIYYNLVELEDVQSTTINSSGNDMPAAVATTLEDIYAESNTDSQFYNMWVTFDGWVHEVPAGQYTNTHISWYDADLNYYDVMVYYNSGSDAAITTLEGLYGHKITAEVIIKDYHSQGYWRINAAKDAVATDLGELTDQDKANLAAAMVEFTGLDALISNLALPAGNEDMGATFAWASDNEAAVSSAGVVTAVAGSEGLATLTLTATVGTATAEKTFDCVVMDLNDAQPTSVDEALDAPDDSYVIVTGVVTGFYYDNPFIQDADGTAIVVEDMEGMVMVGDEIVVSGFIATDDYYDERRLIEDAVLQEVVSSGNELFVIDDQDNTIVVADNSLAITNKLYNMDLTVANAPANASENPVIDTYGYVFFVGDGTTFLTMKAEDFMPGFADMYVAGDVINLTFIMSDVHFNNIRMAAVIPPMQDWVAYGWTMTETDGEFSFDYSGTDANQFWNNNAQLPLWPLGEYTTSIDVTLTAPAEDFMLKVEITGGANLEVPFTGTGAEQVVSIPLDSFTEEQIPQLNLIVLFATTVDGTGTIVVHGVEFVETLPTPDWNAYGWTMVQTEDAYIFGYSGTDSSQFWNNNAQFPIDPALDPLTQAIDVTLMAEAGETFMLKIEITGGANLEVPFTATGEEQVVSIPLSGFTAEQIPQLNLIVLFATTVDGVGDIAVYSVEKVMPDWNAYGWTMTIDGDDYTFGFSGTDANQFWNNNAQYPLPEPLAANTASVDVTLTAPAQDFMLKIEITGGAFLEVPFTGTGAEQVVSIPLDGFTAEQIPQLSLIVLFATTVDGTGDITVHGIEYVEAAPEPDVFISEYIEGSSSNKAIELYNPTDAAIDLTGYVVVLYSNGSTDPGNTLDLTGQTIGAGETLVIYNSGAVADITDVGDISSNITYYNGNDAVTLEKDGVVIDIIGEIGVDTTWTVGDGATAEYTLRRDPSVGMGNATFTPSEWVVFPQNTFDGLGAHTVN